MKLKKGCQTITWGDHQAERFDAVLRAVAEAGFEGVEIGFRHVRRMPPETLNQMLDRHHLALFALHVGGNLSDTGQASSERGGLDAMMEYLERTGSRTLLYSGLKAENAEEASPDIDMLCRAAERADSRGVRILYHNHNWEFKESGIMERLLASAPPSLGLCPDIGWLMRGEVDILDFLGRNASRVGAIHFKDFATRRGDGGKSPNLDTVPLGTGVVPLRETAAWLRDAGTIKADPLWVIAEQDHYDGDPAEAAKINARFLNDVFKGNAS